MSTADPLIGQTLGPCRLDALIGRGGMGRVYRARHLALDRVVAVKLVDVGGAAAGTTGDAVREQILAEARSAAKLEDPRIVAIHEVGEDRGIPYIVMQWVDGESLEARVNRQGRLPLPEALEIIRETATALDAAHRAGLVHRDIKPGNILVDARGTVKLADFGIARPAGVASAATEAVAGSFHFMAPEQAFGGPPDPRSDLYALGTTWYYALTAQPPYPGSAMDALARHRDEPPPEVRLLRPEVTERAASLLRRLMAKKVEERPADARALLREMLSVGMLLDTDTSGSPFKILPAAPRPEARPPEARPPSFAAPPPRERGIPLPPAPAAAPP
ncbi:MAG: serine/threonine protein kinase, partial [Elusimicrobia bacterium]|nr:serine/threonine protein kinase [Elusimicrobiota bacterium]